VYAYVCARREEKKEGTEEKKEGTEEKKEGTEKNTKHTPKVASSAISLSFVTLNFFFPLLL